MSAREAPPYQLLDTGGGRKLERVGAWLVDRQATGAVWPPRLTEEEWAAADAVHRRSDTGGGHWDLRRRLPETWEVAHGGFVLEVRPTPFGHLGLFPEQAEQWSFLADAVRRAAGGPAPRILNLFAYTGGASLALAAAGAEVCHVDAARGIVDWARRNARRNGLEDRPVRWIVDDAPAFLQREERRGRRYDGVVLDPPSYGRGKRKEVFRIDHDLPPLLEACGRVMNDRPLLILLTCHTPGYTPLTLRNLALELLPATPAGSEWGEMSVREEGAGRPLPSGAFFRQAPPVE